MHAQQLAGDVKSMRLRYAGTCAGCQRSLPAGERAHYLRASKTVRCLDCGRTWVTPFSDSHS